MSGSLDKSTAERLVDLLRLSGNETQLTRAMSVLMRDREDLCRSMVESLLRLAVPAQVLPTGCRLTIHNETPALRTRRFSDKRLGRVDWRFSAVEDPERFQLVVEVKIDSRPGADQFKRYLRDERVTAATSGGVLALTKHPLGRDELPDDIRRDPHWRGHVRWHRLLPALLRDAPPASTGRDAVVWEAILRRAAEVGDLGAAVPDWFDLEDAKDDARVRYAVLRAAVEEIRSGIDDLRSPLKVRKRGDVVLVAVGFDEVVALEFTLRGSGNPTLHVVFWPPSRPVRRKAWDDAILAMLAAGWTVHRNSLQKPSIPLERTSESLYLTVADALWSVIEPLSQLLQRYWTVTAGGTAKAAHLEALATTHASTSRNS